MTGMSTVIAVHLRHGVQAAQVDALAKALDGVTWTGLQHAYGSAADVPPLLYAVAVGQADARRAAWWELWGNVHHQGTVYSATAAAVPFIASIAEDEVHPDRVQAVAFLRSLALGDGRHADAVRAGVQPYAAMLVERLPREPDLVRRGIAWLASAFPSLAEEDDEVSRLVPEPMRATWREVLDRVRQRGGDDDTADEVSDAVLDREDELERWALAGWTEPTENDR